MNITQLTESLKQAFFEENHRLVFWFDFGQQINFISLPLVKSEAVEKVKKIGLFETLHSLRLINRIFI
jgi:hypothetical protein